MHLAEFEIAPDEDADTRTAAGVPWEEIEHGGKITIARTLAAVPAFRTAAYAADRWRAVEINGRPAAVADPTLPLGIGRSAIVMWDPETGVRTILSGFNRTIDELIQVAEELQ
jgi:hypothetical protein